MNTLNKYEQAIVKNADWFVMKQTREGFINVDGDEFYGVRGDATLIGHSVTVRMYAYVLTEDERYLDLARDSLFWLALRQDSNGGWKNHAAFTLDGAQCVFEGFNTYQSITGNRQFQPTLKKAARRMVMGTIDHRGNLLLPNVIEIGEYAHFALLAWKTTGDDFYKNAANQIVNHITRNFDEAEEYWYPFDVDQIRSGALVSAVRPLLRWSTFHVPLKGKMIARLGGGLASYLVETSRPQYAMNLMDSEALLNTLDGSCEFPMLKKQTEAAIGWAQKNCRGPFQGSLVESKSLPRSKQTYPIPIINDNELAALWPTTCLLLAYCGMNEQRYAKEARDCADWILSVQNDDGSFCNFQRPDGTLLPLKSGNVNFYGSMALWYYRKIYGGEKAQYAV